MKSTAKTPKVTSSPPNEDDDEAADEAAAFTAAHPHPGMLIMAFEAMVAASFMT